MGPCSLRRRLPALALLGSLVLLPAAARALPVGSGPEAPAAVREQVGGLLDWLGQTFLSLWAGDSGENGKLIDPNGQPAPGWGYDHRQMLDAVRRDLEELLNTRQPDPPPEFPEVARSVVAYGLPDLSSVGGASIPQRDALCRVIEATIARYEPRLRKVRVTIADPPDRAALAVRFHVEAALNVDPAPEVTFETVLDLTSGRATVTRDGGPT